MEQKNKIFNLGTFFCLYIAQTIPMSFFSTVIPVMMRQENFSLSAIGLLQLIKLPWILKFLWSPMVDRHARTTGDYKRWIFSSELIYAVLIFAVAFLDFKTDFYTIIALIIVSFVASATQDIATDALAVLSFSRKDKSHGEQHAVDGQFRRLDDRRRRVAAAVQTAGMEQPVALRCLVRDRCFIAVTVQPRTGDCTERYA